MTVHHVQQAISIQSTSFWRVVSECCQRAHAVYAQNLDRPPVAGGENIEASAAVLVLVVSLESHLNRLMFFEAAGLTTDVPMLGEVETYLTDDEFAVLRVHLSELTVCRDAVTHALIWQERRTFDEAWRPVEHVTELAPITKLRKKVLERLSGGG